MATLASRLQRLREALAVAKHGVALRDQATLFGCYLRLLAGTPGARVRTARMRFGRIVRDVSFRESDIFTFGEILHEGQYRLPSGLPPAPTIIDAGANIGVAAMWMLGQYPDATLVAFEPEPGNAALLSANLRGLPRVRVEQAAIGAEDGEVRLFLAGHGAEHSLMTSGPQGDSVSVPCHRLDGYMARHGIRAVDVLKLDVEGSEAQVLVGLGDRLTDVRHVLGEFHEALVREEDFYAPLARAGFELHSRTAIGQASDQVHGFAMSRPLPAGQATT